MSTGSIILIIIVILMLFIIIGVIHFNKVKNKKEINYIKRNEYFSIIKCELNLETKLIKFFNNIGEKIVILGHTQIRIEDFIAHLVSDNHVEISEYFENILKSKNLLNLGRLQMILRINKKEELFYVDFWNIKHDSLWFSLTHSESIDNFYVGQTDKDTIFLDHKNVIYDKNFENNHEVKNKTLEKLKSLNQNKKYIFMICNINNFENYSSHLGNISSENLKKRVISIVINSLNRKANYFYDWESNIFFIYNEIPKYAKFFGIFYFFVLYWVTYYKSIYWINKQNPRLWIFIDYLLISIKKNVSFKDLLLMIAYARKSLLFSNEKERNLYFAFDSRHVKNELAKFNESKNDLNEELQKSSLDLIYKPIINLKKKKIIGNLALIKFNNKKYNNNSYLFFQKLNKYNVKIKFSLIDEKLNLQNLENYNKKNIFLCVSFSLLNQNIYQWLLYLKKNKHIIITIYNYSNFIFKNFQYITNLLNKNNIKFALYNFDFLYLDYFEYLNYKLNVSYIFIEPFCTYKMIKKENYFIKGITFKKYCKENKVKIILPNFKNKKFLYKFINESFYNFSGSLFFKNQSIPLTEINKKEIIDISEYVNESFDHKFINYLK